MATFDTKSQPLMQEDDIPFSEQIEDLQEWVSSKECIDMYQYIALMHGTYTNCNEDGGIISSYMKLIACLCLQTIGIIYVCIYYHGEISECGDYDDPGIPMQIIAYFLSLFITSTSIDMILTTSSTGLYSWYKNKKNFPKFVNKCWLGIGLTINILNIVCCAITSIFAILSSDDIGDMLLNSIAIYFILELDDQIVSWGDLDRIKDFIEQYKEMNGDLERVREEKSGCCSNGCNKCCNSCEFIGDVLLWSCYVIAQNKMFRGFLRMTLPVAMIYVSSCYQ